MTYYMEKSFSSHYHHGDRFNTVLTNGKFYYPAWKHYEKRVNVVCDRCKTDNLPVCVGLGSTDLCMMCVSELARRPSFDRSPVNYDCNYGFDDDFLMPKSTHY